MAEKLMPEDLLIIEALSNSGAVTTGATYAKSFEIANDGETRQRFPDLPGEVGTHADSPKTNWTADLRTLGDVELKNEAGGSPRGWKKKALDYAFLKHNVTPEESQALLDYLNTFRSEQDLLSSWPYGIEAMVDAVMHDHKEATAANADFDFGREDESIQEARRTLGGDWIADDVPEDPEEYRRRAIAFVIDKWGEYGAIADDIIDHLSVKIGMASKDSPEMHAVAAATAYFSSKAYQERLKSPDANNFGREDESLAEARQVDWWTWKDKALRYLHARHPERVEIIPHIEDEAETMKRVNRVRAEPDDFVESLITWDDSYKKVKGSEFDSYGFGREDESLTEAVDEDEIEQVLDMMTNVTPEERQEVIDCYYSIGDTLPSDMSSEEFVKEYLASLRGGEEVTDKTMYLVPNDFGREDESVQEARRHFGINADKEGRFEWTDDFPAEEAQEHANTIKEIAEEYGISNIATAVYPNGEVYVQGWTDSLALTRKFLEQGLGFPPEEAASYSNKFPHEEEGFGREDESIAENAPNMGYKGAEGFDNQVAYGLTNPGVDITDEAVSDNGFEFGNPLKWIVVDVRNDYTQIEAEAQLSGKVLDGGKFVIKYDGHQNPSTFWFWSAWSSWDDGEDRFPNRQGYEDSIEDAKEACDKLYKQMMSSAAISDFREGFDPALKKDAEKESHEHEELVDKYGMEIAYQIAADHKKEKGVKESVWHKLNEMVSEADKYYLVQSATKRRDGVVHGAIIHVGSDGRPQNPHWKEYSNFETFLEFVDIPEERYQLQQQAEMLWNRLDHKEMALVIDPTDSRSPINSTSRWERKGGHLTPEPS